MIVVDRQSDIPLIRQLYKKISAMILAGELKAAEKLPSSRELAASLEISRNVVVEAYEILASEGYVYGRQGSGMYVAENACFEKTEINTYTERIKEKLFDDNRDIINFRSGLPALEMFPVKKWSSLYSEVCLELPAKEMGYGDPSGCLKLRRELARYLYKSRGVSCNPENIIITTGAVQALQICARQLTSKDDDIILEDPSNYDLQRILSSNGAELNPLDSDSDGIDTSLLPEDKSPKLIYVTPSHQFPLGGILPIQRRIELIRYARKKNCYIIEDDYDSEYRYEGPPVSSLQSLDAERVIYIGTFSKTMFPSLRLGYMVLPEALVSGCRRLKKHSDFQTPVMEQLTMAKFIDKGYLDRHIAKMKKVYLKRQQNLINCLETFFPRQFSIFGYSTGLHLVVEFGFEVTTRMVSNLKRYKVRIIPVDVHSMKRGVHKNRFIFGYGHLHDDRIYEGIKRIHAAFTAAGLCENRN